MCGWHANAKQGLIHGWFSLSASPGCYFSVGETCHFKVDSSSRYVTSEWGMSMIDWAEGGVGQPIPFTVKVKELSLWHLYYLHTSFLTKGHKPESEKWGEKSTTHRTLLLVLSFEWETQACKGSCGTERVGQSNQNVWKSMGDCRGRCERRKTEGENGWEWLWEFGTSRRETEGRHVM